MVKSITRKTGNIITKQEIRGLTIGVLRIYDLKTKIRGEGDRNVEGKIANNDYVWNIALKCGEKVFELREVLHAVNKTRFFNRVNSVDLFANVRRENYYWAHAAVDIKINV